MKQTIIQETYYLKEVSEMLGKPMYELRILAKYLLRKKPPFYQWRLNKGDIEVLRKVVE